MTAFFIYLLKVIVCSAMFAGCYWWVLRNGRFYQWDRFYIVTSVVLSIIIPLLNISMSTPHNHHCFHIDTQQILYFIPIIALSV